MGKSILAGHKNTEELTAHLGRSDNPHGVTAAQTGADPAGTGAWVQQRFEPLLRFHGGLGNEYVWKRYLTRYTPLVPPASDVAIQLQGGYEFSVKYAASIDPVTGLMVNPAVETFRMGINENVIYHVAGMYWSNSTGTGNVPKDLPQYYTDAGAAITVSFTTGYGNRYVIPAHMLNFVYQDYDISYVNSPNPNAYPIADGYQYEGPIQLGGKAGLFFTEYIGSGTAGASTPNTLTFPFRPKFVMVFLANSGSEGPFSRTLVRTGSSEVFSSGFPWASGQKLFRTYGTNANGTAIENAIRFAENGNTLSWYAASAAGQMNEPSIYRVIAIG